LGNRSKDQAVAFCGYLIDPNSLVAFNSAFNAKEVIFQTPIFGKICLLGSETATDEVRRHLERMQELRMPRMRDDIKPDPLAISIPHALQLSGILLEAEMRTYESLYNFYGGGYEIASLGERGFGKVDDLTYLFWYAEIYGEHVKLKPLKAFKYKYYGEVLAVRTLTYKDGEAESITFDDSTHLIQPSFRDITDEEIRNFVYPDMNSKFICNYFLAHDPARGTDVLTRIDFVKSSEANVKFEPTADGFVLAFKASFIHEVIASIKARFSKLKTNH